MKKEENMKKWMLRAALMVVCASAVGMAWAQISGKEGYVVGETVPPAKKAPPSAPAVRELKWTDLLPKEWNPERLFADLGKFRDGDPRADALLEKIRKEWDNAPVVRELDGTLVRLPGFLVMLEGSSKGVTEFLLVPYFGACIHVPPPPANQLVHVVPEQPVPEDIAMDPLWVTGTIRSVYVDTKMGSSGYHMTRAKVEKYSRR
jgi:uncharacterized protein